MRVKLSDPIHNDAMLSSFYMNFKRQSSVNAGKAMEGEAPAEPRTGI